MGTWGLAYLAVARHHEKVPWLAVVLDWIRCYSSTSKLQFLATCNPHTSGWSKVASVSSFLGWHIRICSRLYNKHCPPLKLIHSKIETSDPKPLAHELNIPF